MLRTLYNKCEIFNRTKICLFVVEYRLYVVKCIKTGKNSN